MHTFTTFSFLRIRKKNLKAKALLYNRKTADRMCMRFSFINRHKQTEMASHFQDIRLPFTSVSPFLGFRYKINDVENSLESLQINASKW